MEVTDYQLSLWERMGEPMPPEDCPECEGRGVLEEEGPEDPPFSKECPDCQGQGWV